MNVFIFASTVLFLMLTVTWSKHGWVNFFIKMIFAGMTVTGMFFSLAQLGYVIKAA